MDSTNNGDGVTSFDNMCSILSDLWMNYKYDEEFEDFVQYNDLGLPLAFLIAENLVEPKEIAKAYISETWDIFLEALSLEDDKEWQSLEEMLFYAKEKGER